MEVPALEFFFRKVTRFWPGKDFSLCPSIDNNQDRCSIYFQTENRLTEFSS